jgi:general secretion pathway protein C
VLRPGLTAIIIAAMLAWAGHSLARLFWLFNSPQPSAAAGPVVPVASPVARNGLQAERIDIAYLQENFRLSNGRGDLGQSTDNGDLQQAANTRLSLVLRGSIAGSSAANSSAIIASGDRQQVYSVNDELALTTPGVTLDSVHPRYVVLNNNGRLETLWMYDPQDSTDTPPPRADGSAAGAERANNAAAPQINGQVQVRIYRENGNVRGLQIRQDSDAGMLRAAGLQAGDIITAVDGVAVDQGGDLSALTRELQNRDRIDLELIRNSNTMTVTVRRDAFAF